jgi:hypothetical protein
MDFATAARELARNRDDPVQHSAIKGGGIRLTGFRQISIASFHMLLRAAGRRCVYTSSPETNTIIIDTQLGSQTAPASDAEAGPRIGGTASYVNTYTYKSISSEVLDELLEGAHVVDAIMSCGSFNVLVAPPSQILGGVADTIKTKGSIYKRRQRLEGNRLKKVKRRV